jgi:type II restriction/modification system DNA methylase subunit YeeA
MPSFSLPEFVAHWKKSTLTERSASQTHFNGLCDLLDHPRPAEFDPTGVEYTFEKGANKTEGGQGWADVWKRGYFAWEYKGKRKNLDEAYKQLLQYREDLENPPLLVTCDLDRFEVHTNFTNTATQIYKFELADLLITEPLPNCPIPAIDVLRMLFTNPSKLRPGLTPEQVTEKAAAKFSQLAKSLRDRNVDPEQGAHFLMRILFCLFSEDIGLLPEKLFSRLVNNSRTKPAEFDKRLKQLFAAMSMTGGSFGADDIPYFNGGLFSDDQTYPMTASDLDILAEAATLDWAHVEPAIFGTLFERSLDPSKRSQLGAHYTSKEDILHIVEPVLMTPLRTEWEAVKTTSDSIVEKLTVSSGAVRTKYKAKLRELLLGFADKVSKMRILDPACGSGNFLYVALKSLLDLEKQISMYAANNGLSGLLPRTDPSRLYGIEANVYAHELASVVVWIGYIQWQYDNGFNFGAQPILRPLQNIRRGDAVMDESATPPVDPAWPDADVIIGNPPFLGDKKMRGDLGDKYTEALRNTYKGRIPGASDLVCYWFEKAREMVAENRASRVGLLATQGIRGGRNRTVLDRIKQTGDIFWAESDRDWILEGANVHVSMIGFDNGSESARQLNGNHVARINSDLTSFAADLTTARPLAENKNLAFIGSQKGGRFNLSSKIAAEMLAKIGNPNGRPNSDVIRPWANAKDITQQLRGMMIIDFGIDMVEGVAAQYEAPFEYLKTTVREKRLKNIDRDSGNESWWLHQRPRPEMRSALIGKVRYIATPRHSKHRVFTWLKPDMLADSALVVIARDDDYMFGVLHSRVHELWARRRGTQVREVESGFRYTPKSTFEPFPFPWSPGAEPPEDPRVAAISACAANLNKMRLNWLEPSGATTAELAQRTLTALYNQWPSWLSDLHIALDQAVLEAYGWPVAIPDDEILERLLEINHSRTPQSESELSQADEEDSDEDNE